MADDLTSEDLICRSILAADSDRCFINDWARTGVIGNNSLYNDFYWYEYDTQEMKAFLCQDIAFDDTTFSCCVNHDGRVFLHDYNREQFYLLDENGTLLASTQYDELKIDLDKIGNTYLGCDQNYIYLANGNEFEVLNYNLESVFYQSEQDQTCVWKLYSNSAQSCLLSLDHKKYYRYNKDKGLVEEDFRLAGSLVAQLELVQDGRNIYTGDNQYDFYCQTKGDDIENKEGIIDFIGVKNGVAYRLFSFRQMGFEAQQIVNVVSGGNGNFIVCYLNPATFQHDFYRLEPCDEVMDYSVTLDKEVVTVACIFAPGEMRKAVLAFNNTSEEYYVDLVEYNEQYDNANDSLNALYLDVAVNQTTDAVLLYGLDKNNLTQKGVF